MRNRVKRPPLRYFFYKGDLHKKIHINRQTDLITAWHYKSGKPVQHSYLDVKKNGGQAFTTNQVSAMLNRHRNSLKRAMDSGILMPEMTYGLDENRNPYKYMWSEKNIMDAHEYFAGVHRGRPRDDEWLTPAYNLPTEKELRAMIRQGIRYVEGIEVNGEFIPTWGA